MSCASFLHPGDCSASRLLLVVFYETNADILNREDLREQHAIGEEISEAITSGVATSGIDEDELDEELAELQQEKLDEDMLKTGNVPVNDKVATGRLPAAPSTEVRGKAQRVEEDDEEEELRKLQAEMAM